MSPTLIESLAIGAFGATVGAYVSNKLAKNRSREQNVYIPIFNRVQGVINTLDYNTDKGEFQKVWEPLDGHIKRGIDEEISGPLVMFDGNVSELNRFITNYKIVLENKASESDLVREQGREHRFRIDDEQVEVPVEKLVNRYGETIIATSEKNDLWKRLSWKVERGQFHNEIKNWDPFGERIDLLWKVRVETYQNDPSMVKPPDEVYSETIDYIRMADESLKSKIDYVE